MREYFRPRYESDNDYTTNAPSYYDDLARKQKLIKELAMKIWEYDKILASKLKEVEDTLTKYSDILDGKIEDFDDIILNKTQAWLETHMEEILSEAIQTVWFGLNDEGYFIAVIPESWSEISFDTNGDGQLILTY